MKGFIKKQSRLALVVIGLIALPALQASADNATETSTTSAASSERPWLAVAPKFGLTSFSINGDVDAGSKSGISVGGMVYYPLSEKMDFEVGLEYLQAGGNSDSFFFAGTDYSLEYLSIPLGVRYRAWTLGEQGHSNLYFRGGIAPSVLLSSKVSVEGATSQDIKGNTNSTDIFGYVGFGGTIGLNGGQEILIELNYMQGFQDTFKDQTGKNFGMVASVAYSLPL